jgi:hypothetical protein
MSFLLDALQGGLIKHWVKGETEANKAFEKWTNAGK